LSLSSRRMIFPGMVAQQRTDSRHWHSWAAMERADSRAAPVQFFQSARKGWGRAWNVVSLVCWRVNTRLRGSYTGHASVAITVQQ
jgi:hypothetical protein